METQREEQWRERVAARLALLVLLQHEDPSPSGHLTRGTDLLLDLVRAAYREGYAAGLRERS